jgi:hypothetical protein
MLVLGLLILLTSGLMPLHPKSYSLWDDRFGVDYVMKVLVDERFEAGVWSSVRYKCSCPAELYGPNITPLVKKFIKGQFPIFPKIIALCYITNY